MSLVEQVSNGFADMNVEDPGFQTQAGKYASKFGYKTMAEEGRGDEYNKNLTETAFSRIRASTVANRDQSITNLTNAGMLFTGVSEVKAPNAIMANNAAQAFDVVNQVTQQDSEFKMDMANKWINILNYEDNYAVQQEQLELQRQAQEQDLFDVMGSVGAIVSSFATI